MSITRLNHGVEQLYSLPLLNTPSALRPVLSVHVLLTPGSTHTSDLLVHTPHPSSRLSLALCPSVGDVQGTGTSSALRSLVSAHYFFCESLP